MPLSEKGRVAEGSCTVNNEGKPTDLDVDAIEFCFGNDREQFVEVLPAGEDGAVEADLLVLEEPVLVHVRPQNIRVYAAAQFHLG